MSKNHNLPPIGESGELLAKRETLIVGAFCSVCGNCGGNADAAEARHEMIELEGYSACGVTYKYITGEGRVDQSFARRLRPDLEWVSFDNNLDGITTAMEERVIADLTKQPPLLQ